MPNVSNITGFKKKALPTNKKKILYVGRLIPRKGVKYLLEAYEQLNISDTELIIIGTGPDEEKLKEYVKKNNMKNVVFTGKIENNQLKKYYNESCLVVIPSINESMGDPWVFVLNEAMYYENPIIATDAVGAAPDMIKDNGFIVEEKNSTQLKEAMLKILSDDKLQDMMSKKSRKIICEKFQYSNMVDGFNRAISYVKK